MKKRVFAAVAVLVALAVFSCVDPIMGTTEPVQYTDDGRPMVNLTIGTGSSGRALTTALAKPGVDYYEVTFFDGNTYYRAAWDYTRDGKIRVPAGTYDTADKAILFAGSFADKTLIAVGVITANNGSSATVGTIDEDTTSVTFTMSPLLNDVRAHVNSSFQITGPGTPTTSYTTNFPTARLGTGRVIPMFVVPKDESVAATYTIYTGAIGATSTFADFADGIIVGPATGSKVFRAGISSMDGEVPVLVDDTTTIDATVIVPDAPFPSDGIIPLTIDTPNEAGLCKIALQVPVYAIGLSTASPAMTWYIRGGLENSLFDEGAENKSIGGAILLGIGVTRIDIIIN